MRNLKNMTSLAQKKEKKSTVYSGLVLKCVTELALKPDGALEYVLP